MTVTYGSATVSYELSSGTLYQPGDIVNITWETDSHVNWNAGFSLSIQLYATDGYEAPITTAPIITIASNLPGGTAAYQWTIPNYLPGTDYFIRVCATGNYLIGGNSDDFTLNTDNGIIIYSSPTSSSVFIQGVEADITWSTENVDADEEADLYIRKQGSGNQGWVNITEELLPGDVTTYSWTPPATFAQGYYELGFVGSSLDNPDDSSFYISSPFKILKRSITITSPVSDSVVIQGEDFDITWTSTGYGSDGTDPENDVSIYYRDIDGDNELVLIDTIATSAGTLTWSVPADISERYEIVFRDAYYSVSSADYSTTETTSDSFEITEKTITITFPDDGGILHADQGYDITWTYTGYADTDTVSIKYKTSAGDWDESEDVTEIVAAEAIGSEKYRWDLTGLSEGTYQLRIYRGTDFFPAEDEELDVVVTDAILDFNSLKRKTILLTVQNNKIHYENSSHQMTVLTDATVRPDSRIATIAAYQKIFIADGNHRDDPTYPGFRIFDPVAVKVTVASGASDFIVGERAYTSATGKIFTVDHINSDTVFYLYPNNAAALTLVSTDVLVNAGGTASATVSAVDSGPHWIDWDSRITAGSLPDSANIGCLYRGRIALAGDKTSPHMWYLSRQGAPYDYLYAESDAQSAVAGGDGDAGEVGDIITALIPFHDDQLLIGCNQELWLMRGDPAAGGSLDSLTTSDGVFDSQSWCFGPRNELYFMDVGGLYVLAYGSYSPEPLSHSKIPTIMRNITRETHWITMVYDVHRHGILIYFTTRPGQTNVSKCEAWWYDLSTGGFFPETYPINCGVYAATHYNSNSSSYNKLIVGCDDGYLRTYDDSQKGDDMTADTAGAASAIINSHVTLSPQRISQEGYKGTVNQISITTGGGVRDTDSVDYEVYVSDTAQGALDATTAIVSGTITGTIRQVSRSRFTGAFISVRLTNDSAKSSWSLEEITAEAVSAGRVRS